MRTHLPLLFGIFIFAALALPDRAEARKRGLPLVIINTGTEIARVADLPEGLADQPELKGWSLGYKYEHFGILWADVWTWDKELVIFKDDTYSEIPEEVREELEAEYPFSDSDRNLWNRFGILAAVIGMGGFALVSRASG